MLTFPLLTLTFPLLTLPFRVEPAFPLRLAFVLPVRPLWLAGAVGLAAGAVVRWGAGRATGALGRAAAAPPPRAPPPRAPPPRARAAPVEPATSDALSISTDV